MTHSPRTLRLYNIDQSNRQLSFQLNVGLPKTASRLRRGATLTAVLIKPHGFYDVCASLSVDVDEAWRIFNSSPEAKAKQTSRQLLAREHPPSAETLAKEGAARAKAEAAAARIAQLNPPDLPSAVPAGVDQVAAGLRGPNEPPLPTQKGQPAVLDAPVPQMPPPAAAADASDETTADKTSTPLDEVVPPPPVSATADENLLSREPSMDWSEADLRTYSAAKGIDLGRSGSKTQILKKIRRAMKG